ncbi:hypothetical protein [Nostoc sp. CCY 9925]|uniref:hypothetical protein n=1 Tax=Nostoc sp. CCY 9925 TaxID=3103865 RepID=UPI0039C757CF
MNATQSLPDSQFSSVYGPVKSWRFGSSLGIDPRANASKYSTCILRSEKGSDR